MHSNVVALPSRLDGQLAAQQQRFAGAGDTERAELIARVRRFKSSWVELAEALTNLQRSQRYTAWGYASFEEYYRKELRLRSATVNKLVGTYAFVRKSAPDVLKRDGVTQEIPSLQSLDFLRRAEMALEERQAPLQDVEVVRQAILEDGWPASKAARQFKDVLFPDAAQTDGLAAEQALLRQVAQLTESMKVVGDRLPSAVQTRVLEAVQGLLEALADLRAERRESQEEVS